MKEVGIFPSHKFRADPRSGIFLNPNKYEGGQKFFQVPIGVYIEVGGALSLKLKTDP